jgi:[protein-PII] uridylyltransferase
VLELRTSDRIGLLYRVAAALEAEDLDVRWARVSTLGSSVLDAFCLETTEHEGLDPDRRRRVEEAVLGAARNGDGSAA